MTKARNPKQSQAQKHVLVIRILHFEFVSDFDIRISDSVWHDNEVSAKNNTNLTVSVMA